MTRRALAALGLTVLLMASWVSSARAQQARVDAQELLARLESAKRLAQNGVRVPSRGLMAEVRRTLGLPLSLDLENRTIRIPKDPILESLDGDTAGEFRIAGVHLSFLESQIRAANQAAQPDPSQVSRALLAAYRGVSISASPIDELRLLVNRAFTAAVEFVFRLLLADDRSFAILRILALVIIVLGLWLVARYGLRRVRLVPARRLRPAGGGADGDIDWQETFDQAMANGDLRKAVRARYQLLLATLAARGFVRDDPSLTAGECRQAVGALRPELFPSIAEATLTFETIAYGDGVPERADIERIKRAETLAEAS